MFSFYLKFSYWLVRVLNILLHHASLYYWPTQCQHAMKHNQKPMTYTFIGVFFLGMGGGLGDLGDLGVSDLLVVEVLLLLSFGSVLLMMPLLTDTVRLGIGGPATSSSSLKTEFLLPFVRSIVGI